MEQKEIRTKIAEYIKKNDITVAQICNRVGYTNTEKIKKYLNGEGFISPKVIERFNTYIDEH